jgi:hypothetical protein
MVPPVAWHTASMLQRLARAVHCLKVSSLRSYWQDNVSLSCNGTQEGLERDLILTFDVERNRIAVMGGKKR